MGKGCVQRKPQVSREIAQARWSLAFAKTDEERQKWRKEVKRLEAEPIKADEFKSFYG